MPSRYHYWDWTELAKVLNLPIWEDQHISFEDGDPDTEKVVADAIKDCLSYLIDDLVGGRPTKKITLKKASQVRRWVTKFAERSHSTSKPLYQGLAKIKDDPTFLTYVRDMLENLWD